MCLVTHSIWAGPRSFHSNFSFTLHQNVSVLPHDGTGETALPASCNGPDGKKLAIKMSYHPKMCQRCELSILSFGVSFARSLSATKINLLHVWQHIKCNAEVSHLPPSSQASEKNTSDYGVNECGEQEKMPHTHTRTHARAVLVYVARIEWVNIINACCRLCRSVALASGINKFLFLRSRHTIDSASLSATLSTLSAPPPPPHSTHATAHTVSLIPATLDSHDHIGSRQFNRIFSLDMAAMVRFRCFPECRAHCRTMETATSIRTLTISYTFWLALNCVRNQRVYEWVDVLRTTPTNDRW